MSLWWRYSPYRCSHHQCFPMHFLYFLSGMEGYWMAYGHKTNSDCREWNIAEHRYMNGIALGNRVWMEKIMIKILAFHLWLPRRTEYVSKGRWKFTTKNRGFRKHLPAAFKGPTHAVHKNCFSILKDDKNIPVKLLLQNVCYLCSLLGLKPSCCSLSCVRQFKV